MLAAAAQCSHVKYLGVPHLLGRYNAVYPALPGLQPWPVLRTAVISPSIYPVRTALDIFTGLGPRLAQPWGFPGLPGWSGLPALPAPAAAQSAPAAPATPAAEDAVDVAAEVEEETGVPGGVITIQQRIEALPSPAASLFRDPSGPPIPAGIVQATQPVFVQTVFKVRQNIISSIHITELMSRFFQNPKVSPELQLVGNSKASSVLQQIRDQAAGIAVV